MSQRVPSFGLEKQGFATGAAIHWNLTTAPLIELAVKRGEGLLSKDGPLASARSGATPRDTGRQVIMPGLVRATGRAHAMKCGRWKCWSWR